MSESIDGEDEAGENEGWYAGILAAFRRLPNGAEISAGDDAGAAQGDCDDASPGVIESARDSLAAALIHAIRAVSDVRDREEIIDWLTKAGLTLAADKPTTEKAAELYKSADSRRLAGILANTVKTSLNNYQGSSLPLALKFALPVTILGLPFLGLQGAGLVAFGGGVGLPVVLLLFLGAAGVGTVVEALVKDRGLRDPLTKLMVAFVAAEAARRIDKQLLEAMRVDAMVPKRAELPPGHDRILASLLALDPIDFERHVMTFFEADGCTVGLTPVTNDFGVDGYVIHPDGLIIVQCKRYAPGNLVGGPDMTKFWGTMGLKQAIEGWFVTTSGFTSQAAKVAEGNPAIRLVDGAELVRWHVEGRRGAVRGAPAGTVAVETEPTCTETSGQS